MTVLQAVLALYSVLIIALIINQFRQNSRESATREKMDLTNERLRIVNEHYSRTTAIVCTSLSNIIGHEREKIVILKHLETPVIDSNGFTVKYGCRRAATLRLVCETSRKISDQMSDSLKSEGRSGLPTTLVPYEIASRAREISERHRFAEDRVPEHSEAKVPDRTATEKSYSRDCVEDRSSDSLSSSTESTSSPSSSD